MEKYNIEFKRSAFKEIEALQRRDLIAIKLKIDSLVENLRPYGYEKLSAREMYRIRSGDLRVLYTIQDRILIVCVVHVGHRSLGVYRK